MIDLHIHTDHSDGNKSVIEIIEKCKKLELKAISITDHNSVKGYHELKEIKDLPFDIITGVELKCFYKKQEMEILVYDFNFDIIEEFLKNEYIDWEIINKKTTIEFEKILKVNNIKYDNNIVENYDFSKYKCILDLYNSIKKYDSNCKYFKNNEFYEDPNIFYRECVCNKDSLFYIDISKYYPSLDKVIKVLKKSGGKIVFPHVFLYKNGFKILNEINKRYILDGVECYHPSYNLNEINMLLDYCSKNNLFVTAGSDYHGNIYELGCNNIHYDYKKVKMFNYKKWV
jgi:3',5'-nucleoside bisphosphate phosphatase